MSLRPVWLCEAAPSPPLVLLVFMLNPGPAWDPDGGAGGSVGKEEVKSALAGRGQSPGHTAGPALAQGQPVQFVGLPSTPSLTLLRKTTVLARGMPIDGHFTKENHSQEKPVTRLALRETQSQPLSETRPEPRKEGVPLLSSLSHSPSAYL